MLFFRRISGASMMPRLHPGDIVFGTTRRIIRKGDIVVALVDGREVIKRVANISGSNVSLMGDNAAHSTDSRDYGAVSKSAIMGVMKQSFPVRAVEPPKLRFKYGAYLGWGAALIMAAFAVIHLFRIDTFVPELQTALGIDRYGAAWAAGFLVCAEVFALPFLMRMKLSLLAHYVSGAFGVVVPLFWTLLAIWNYGGPASTAQLGEFKDLQSDAIVVGLNLVWLLFAYMTLWALGYDRHNNEKVSRFSKFLSRLSKSS